MKSFKEFISEAPTKISDFDKDEYGVDDHEAGYAHGYTQKNNRGYKHVSDHRGYQIWMDHEHGIVNAVDPETNKVHLTVTGDFHSPKNFSVDQLAGHPSSKIKAHELYHHMIIDLGMKVASSSSQSEGGMKVWKKLSEYPDIDMKHVNPKAKLKLHLHKGDRFHQNYASDKSLEDYINNNTSQDIRVDSKFVAQRKTDAQ